MAATCRAIRCRSLFQTTQVNRCIFAQQPPAQQQMVDPYHLAYSTPSPLHVYSSLQTPPSYPPDSSFPHYPPTSQSPPSYFQLLLLTTALCGGHFPEAAMVLEVVESFYDLQLTQWTVEQLNPFWVLFNRMLMALRVGSMPNMLLTSKVFVETEVCLETTPTRHLILMIVKIPLWAL